jgi:indole-3-glycerol phosphate synthase
VSGFLAEMRAGSAARVAVSASKVSLSALEARIGRSVPPRPLRLAQGAFALLAEVKRSSPALGSLATDASLAARARAYVEGGAAAVSVLTEPARFRGSLEDLAEIAGSVDAPVLRKDFLVDPYQVVEARAHGASGVLLIARILSDAALRAMLDAASACGVFVLLEAFDAEDVRRSVRAVGGRATRGGGVLLGVNARDLETLRIDDGRFAAMAPLLPGGIPRIAESGIASASDLARVAALGYDGALVGTAFMQAPDPRARVAEWAAAANEARP